MPGVRYGPDITDDAAHILDFVKDAQARMRKGLKLPKREQTRYDAFRDIADKVFGVGNKRFDKGQFGDLAVIAQYGGSKSRSKIAKSWRSGGQMKKSVSQEFIDRGTPGGRKAGSTRTPEGAWYVGRTNPKRLREASARAQRRMNRNGATFGAANIPPRSTKPDNFLAQVDKLNITKARGGLNGGSSDIANRPRGVRTGAQPGKPIRPPLPKSAARAQQRKRAKTGTKKARELADKGKTGGKRKK